MSSSSACDKDPMYEVEDDAHIHVPRSSPNCVIIKGERGALLLVAELEIDEHS